MKKVLLLLFCFLGLVTLTDAQVYLDEFDNDDHERNAVVEHHTAPDLRPNAYLYSDNNNINSRSKQKRTRCILVLFDYL